ncbi:molybdate ABC transporter substrate-binding protein [Nitratireductor basaltis]|uniref:Molybdenum ABC transporter periplasmic molybdate-binding protein n=1 Tax=Nitratireductor basaltis TaxID=472175 RepID=A0A084U5H5_9HYPH|nr:molybdate ABC transporter substrate-binding protein [Nitratireductor basaltis]KFB08211.1 Molybdenum ABC transporter periplasmic molybdate-binding protein [Nitratireductor basaltis]
MQPRLTFFLHMLFILPIMALLGAQTADAAKAHIAVAANFIEPARRLVERLEAKSEHRYTLSFASTGQLTAQIIQGAPYDVLLAADEDHAGKLIAEGLALKTSRFTYALGRLALWAGGEAISPETVRKDPPQRFAIANPETAPYGRAAVQSLEKLELAELMSPRLVKGNSVAQTFQFVASGNAGAGMVALSQLHDQPIATYWPVPSNLHDPIIQDAVLLTPAADNAAALAFLTFLKSAEARAIITDFGYETGGGA